MSELESFGLIMDVPLSVRAELDHRSISFHELVSLDVDSVVTLSRPSGENIDLYVGEAPLGSGEILVNGTKFGVRVAELAERSTGSNGSALESESQLVGRASPNE